MFVVVLCGCWSFRYKSSRFLTRVFRKKNSQRFTESLQFLFLFSFLALDSSSTTSSASPVLNNYDALEGGGYPGDAFVVAYEF